MLAADPHGAGAGARGPRDLGAALGWAHGRDLSVDDAITYVRELEHITLSQVLLARYTADRAQDCLADVTRLMERLLSAADAGAGQASPT